MRYSLTSARSDCGAGVGQEARPDCDLKLKMCAGPRSSTGGVMKVSICVAGLTEVGCRKAFFCCPAF